MLKTPAAQSYSAKLLATLNLLHVPEAKIRVLSRHARLQARISTISLA
jgi:hypothetical protein